MASLAEVPAGAHRRRSSKRVLTGEGETGDDGLSS